MKNKLILIGVLALAFVFAPTHAQRKVGEIDTPSLSLSGTAVTATADEVNVLDGISATLTFAELDYLDIATLGTAEASKAVTADGSLDITYPTGTTAVYESGATWTAESGSTTNIAGTYQIAGVAQTAGAAEVNLLDGSITANTVASVVPVLDSAKLIQTGAHIGTAGTGCTVVHYGAGKNVVAEITITTADFDVAATAAEGHGYLIYTLPGGALVVNNTYLDYELTTAGACSADQPESALGTVIGSGAIATLTGTTMEDLSAVGSDLIMADCSGTAEVSSLGPNASPFKFVIETGAAHTVHVNFADNWANTDDDIALTGTVRIAYTYLD